MPRPILLPILFLPYIYPAFSQTAIIGIRTKDNEVFIGADSKVSNGFGCKIFQSPVDKRVFFAFSGRVTKSTEFNPIEFARIAASVGGDLKEKVAAFDRIIRPMLLAQIQADRCDSAAFRERYLGGHKNFLEVIFAIRDTTVRLIARQYGTNVAGNNATLTDSVVAYPGNHLDGEVYLGFKGAMMKQSKSSMNTCTDYICYINELINAQSAETPDVVGGDISILRITPLKAKWLQPKPNCRPIRE